MKQIEKGITLLLCVLSSVCIWNCSNDNNAPEPKPEPPETPLVVKISADKTVFKANGVDAVTFTVTANDEKVAADALIIRKKEENETDTIHGSNFSTREAGTYKFYASYRDKTSDEISIDAAAVVVLLKADRDTIKANDRDVVQFTIIADEENVTSSAVITLAGEPETVLDDASFSAKEPSTYTFYATYDGMKSNEIRIEAKEVQYLLTADRTSVRADASEEATFTVTVDGENVTSAAAIFQKYDGTETALSVPVFSTENYGAYTFHAVYEGKKTNDVVINAVYVNKPFFMQHVIMDFTSTICPNCPRVESAIREVQDKLPGQVQRVALHMGGKHCDSDLSGVLGHVANDLSIDDYFPSVKINLKYVEYLSASTMISRITKAISNSTKDRGGVSETGIAVESSANGSDIDFTVKVKSAKTDVYSFFAFIVEDGVTYSQQITDLTSEEGFTTDRNYVHNDIATYSLGGDPLQGVSLGPVLKGKETVAKFTIHVDRLAIRTVNLAKCRIIGYTIRPNGVIDNVVSCPVYGSVHYRYAEE